MRETERRPRWRARGGLGARAAAFPASVTGASGVEPDWAWALYLEKGATGIGQKRFAQFSVWAVATFDCITAITVGR